MIVRRIKSDELTHYGVKGMKWRNHRRSQHGIFDQRKQNILAAGAAAKQKLHQQENNKLSTKAKRFSDSWNEARDADFETLGGEIKDRKKKLKEALKPRYKSKLTTSISNRNKDKGFVTDGNGNYYKKSGNSNIHFTVKTVGHGNHSEPANERVYRKNGKKRR